MSNQNGEIDLVDRVASAAADFGAAADEVDEAAADALGVNRTDLRILGLVHRDGRMSAGRLATLAGLSPAATTTAVQRLVGAGHLVREVDPVDRRRAVLTLTGSAAELIQRVYDPVSAAGRRELQAFTAGELAVIERFLRAGIAVQRAQADRVRSLRSAAQR